MDPIFLTVFVGGSFSVLLYERRAYRRKLDREALAFVHPLFGTDGLKAEIFHLLPDKWPAKRRQILANYVVAGALLLLCSFGYSLYLARANNEPFRYFIFSTAMIGATWLYATIVHTSRQHHCWDTFEIGIGGDTLRRRVSGSPDLVVERQSVKSLAELSCGTIVLVSQGAAPLMVGKDLERRGEFLQQLSAWHAMGPAPARAARARRAILFWLIVLPVLAAFVAIYIASNAWIVMPASLVVIASIAYCVLKVRRDPRVKASKVLWFLWLPFLTALLRIWQVVHP